ncbi:MarR family winged helix-turn-helix transcriptional regulator [Agromyces larvae]|uniref:MarR family transcriptional regulator n=1 Tax=Agromyces larvae TaxID=2929802 RepID=A0ABY4BUW2_9MICO|nr:MarR family transcriptional regulator [Agromyces larvae]UOE42684.1 MarR family transcriptional regulator [Agromyces larvae]
MAQADDDVDAIIDAWAEILPDLDLTPLDVMSRLRRVAIDLHRAREAAFAAAGLRVWEFDILSALRKAPGDGSMTPSELAKTTRTATGTITYRLDRLAARGLVSRTEHPDDQRSRLVAVLPEGRQRVEAAMRTLVGAESEMLSGLSRDQMATVIASLRIIAATAASGH